MELVCICTNGSNINLNFMTLAPEFVINDLVINFSWYLPVIETGHTVCIFLVCVCVRVCVRMCLCVQLASLSLGADGLDEIPRVVSAMFGQCKWLMS